MGEPIRADSIYCWAGKRKIGMTLMSAKIGSLILTDDTLYFVSSGSSGVVLGATWTVDAAALANPGSLQVPVSSITRCEMAKKRSLSITVRNPDGSETDYAFGQQMGMPGGHDWVAQINGRRVA